MNYNRIKEFLAKKGRTNLELAAYIGVNKQAVSTWCSNKNQPEVPTLFRIAEFLDVEAGELLTEKGSLRDIRKKKVVIKKKDAK